MAMPTDAEFLNYIARAEPRLFAAAHPFAPALREAYEEVKARFRHDLGEGRDDIVSRAGALMLAEALLRQPPPALPGA